jgi:hypothetical protein
MSIMLTDGVNTIHEDITCKEHKTTRSRIIHAFTTQVIPFPMWGKIKNKNKNPMLVTCKSR